MTEPQPDPTPPAGDPDGTPATPPADAPAQETDWKAMARKWEKLAKDNSKAADELDKVRKASMSETEKAVAAARAEGSTEAAKTYGTKLAKAEFKAAVAAAGLDLGEATDLIDIAQFVGDDGEVDEAAIKKAVTKLSKLAKATPARSGGEMPGAPGGSGNTRPASIREAYARKYG